MCEREGQKVSIILIGGFHYSGVILSEDEIFLIIRDKFNKEVSLNKRQIEKMEVSSNGY